MKKLFLLIISLFFSIQMCFPTENKNLNTSEIGIVKNLEFVELNESEVAQVKQDVEVKLLSGEFKGETVVIENILTGNPYYDIKLKKGVKVLLHVEETEEGYIYSIDNIKRSGILFWLSALFCALLIYVGKIKGLYSLISIVLTCFLITTLLSPMILIGINPVIGSLLIALLSTAITMYAVGGFNKKSSSAILGCLLSIIFATFLAYATVKIASLNGFTDEEAMFLFSTHPQLDFVGLVISMIILATLGAVMDVAMSIASTINEIYTIDNTKTIKELFKSGMNVGRDIIGTMANTLILVYMGSSLPLILLANNIDYTKFTNLASVVTEISSALIGSCAIIICVPITALVASRLIKTDSKNLEI